LDVEKRPQIRIPGAEPLVFHIEDPQTRRVEELPQRPPAGIKDRLGHPDRGARVDGAMRLREPDDLRDDRVPPREQREQTRQ
jgi:hypothetical protein